MKIKYTFVTGETVEIEVDKDWQGVFTELNRKEQAVNKKETRRHVTLDVLGAEGRWLEDSQYDPAEIIEEEIRRDERKKLLARLQEEVANLTEEQRKLLEGIYINGTSVGDYARQKGVSQAAISNRVKRIKKKMERIFE